MVVNNQGRIGKALIPFFVLLHLLGAGMGWGGWGCTGDGWGNKGHWVHARMDVVR